MAHHFRFLFPIALLACACSNGSSSASSSSGPTGGGGPSATSTPGSNDPSNPSGGAKGTVKLSLKVK